MAKIVPLKTSTFLSIGFDLPPERAAKYLEGKGVTPTWSWDELAADAHHRAFTVAKMAQLDLLNTVHKELGKAQLAGTNFQDFRKALEPTMKARGWWGKVEQVNPKTGKLEQVLAGSPHRLENIYRTNLQSAYQAGRKAQMEQTALIRPYWEYLATIDNRTRAGHRQVNGVVLPASHPFWQTNYPPNGYQCRCRARSLSERQLEARGGPALLAKGQIQIQGWSPDPGFSSDPLDVFKPDLTKYPAKLASQFTKAMAKAPPPAPTATDKAGQKLTAEQALDEVAKIEAAYLKKTEKLRNDMAHRTAEIDQLADAWGAENDLDKASAIMNKLQTARIARRIAQVKLDGMAPPFHEKIHKLFYKSDPSEFFSHWLRSDIGTNSPVGKKALDENIKIGESWFRRVVGRGVLDDTTVYYDKTKLSGGRAHATKITDKASNVALDLRQYVSHVTGKAEITASASGPEIVIHELAHHLENTRRDWLDKSIAFRERRTAGEKLVSMKSLFPNHNYAASEKTRPDKFWSAYIGKEYQDDPIGNQPGRHYASEVLSMGLERLYSDPMGLAREDRDFFIHLWNLVGGN